MQTSLYSGNCECGCIHVKCHGPCATKKCIITKILYCFASDFQTKTPATISKRIEVSIQSRHRLYSFIKRYSNSNNNSKHISINNDEHFVLHIHNTYFFLSLSCSCVADFFSVSLLVTFCKPRRGRERESKKIV